MKSAAINRMFKLPVSLQVKQGLKRVKPIHKPVTSISHNKSDE